MEGLLNSEYVLLNSQLEPDLLTISEHYVLSITESRSKSFNH